MEAQPDAIVVDAGSTDAGPHKLGAGIAIVSRMALRQDLNRLMLGARKLHIPLIIGSAGGSGARKHTLWCMEVIEDICHEIGWFPHIEIIWADIDDREILAGLNEGRVEKMSPNVSDLTPETLARTNGVVAQMGAEPIIEALQTGAEIVLCGRAYDPAPFAALAMYRGHDPALGYHMGKILECGALCCEPGTTKDCMLGLLEDDGFTVWSPNPARKCTPVSVAAHTFYEKSHPYELPGPGMMLDLHDCSFVDAGDGKVRVTGSQIRYMPYTVKLEGARRIAFRTFVIAGIRDPLLIAKLDEVERGVEQSVRLSYGDIPPERYHIRFVHYGIDGVMGPLEPDRTVPHEVGLMFEVIADTQELADAVCASVRSTYLHYGYEGRKSTAGNLAFPFAPSDVSFGPVYEFSVYHLLSVDSPTRLFPMERLSWEKDAQPPAEERQER